jgi:sugar/nucleoside kinase (ribokinase family)
MPPRYPERGEIDVVHIGNVTRDIDPADPRGWRAGGGVTYASLTSARLGLRSAALIGADQVTAAAHELDLLRDAGVDVRIVPLGQGPIFENLETEHGRVQTCVEPGDSLPLVELPTPWLDARAWMVVPIAAETGPEWAAAIPADARVALGWQGLLRTLVAGQRTERKRPSRGPLVGRADLIGVSRADLEPGMTMAELNAVLRPGTRVILTDGPSGGILFEAGQQGVLDPIPYAAVPSRHVDPTGAGDVFLAALLAVWLANDGPSGQPGPTRDDLRFAAAAGGLVVEGVGLPAVPDRATVLARLARKFDKE